jgi:hypothetical protein
VKAASIVVAGAIVFLLVACGGEHRPARERYNEGVAALENKEWEPAQKAFLDAMGQAGVDPELRFAAAYDLGLAYAGQAAQVAAATPPEADRALELYHQAATWFRDALRQRKDDEDARSNLAIALARAQALADEVNKGKNGLEPRLDKVIEEQREIRDGARGLWAAIQAAAAGADPLGQQGQYEALATRERALLAEAGVIGDLAGAEIAAIGAKAEEERSDEEKVRIVQLQNLDIYLQGARTAMGDARRQLQTLQGDAAHRRGEAALEQLKRAREQLLDPIAVLQAVAQDEVTLRQHTDALATIEGRGTLAADVAAKVPEAAPAWLTGETLAERQSALRDRTDEVAARLRAAVDGAAAAADGDAGAAPADPERERLLAQIRAALPAVDDASAAMDRARTALGANKLPSAVAAELDALVALGRAIEQFSELRQLIDLTLGQQQQLVSLFDPAENKELPAAERARAVDTGTAANLDRLARMQALIEAEKAKAEAEAAQAGQGQDPGQAAPPSEQPTEQLEAMRAQYAKAETLRGEALAKVQAMAAALAARGKDPVPPAKEAQAKLEELRTIFFSVIEHLQQLVRDQGETRDQTAAAHAVDDAGRAPLLPGLVGRQGGHVDIGEAIAQALAEQADAAAQAGAQQPQGQGPSPEKMAEAAQEVRDAVGQMQGATTDLTTARDQAQQASYDLQPVLDTQAKALEHLENALRLLSPPPPPEQQQDQKDQQQQEQQQDQKDQKDQQQQQQQAGEDADEAARRMQQVRDAEAQRRREQKERERSQPDPVDKDW